MNYVAIKTNNTISIEDGALCPSYEDLKAHLKSINVEWFETFRFDVGVHRFVALCDSDGKFKELPINTIASVLYGNPNDCIVGNVLVMSDHFDEELYTLSKVETEALMVAVDYILDLINK